MQNNDNLYRSRYDYYYSTPSAPSVSNALNYFENQNVSLFGDPVLTNELTENFDNHLYESLRRNIDKNITDDDFSSNRTSNIRGRNRGRRNSNFSNRDFNYKPSSAHSSSLSQTSDTLDNNNYENNNQSSSIFRTSSASSTNYKLNRIHKKPGKRKNFDLDLLTQNDWINSSDDLEIFENQYHNYGSKRNSIESSNFGTIPSLRPSFSFEDQRLSISHHIKPKSLRPLTTSSIQNVNAFTVLPYDTSSTSHEKSTSEESEHSEAEHSNRIEATPPIIKDKIITGSEYRVELPRSHKNTAFTIINELERRTITPDPQSGRVSPFLGRGFKGTSRSSSPTSMFGANDDPNSATDELTRILNKLEKKRISESLASLNFIQRNDKFVESLPKPELLKTRSLSQIKPTSFEKLPDFLFEKDFRDDYFSTALKSQSTRSLHSKSAHHKALGAKLSTNPRHSQKGILEVVDSDDISISSLAYGRLRRSSVVSSMENLTQFRRKSIFSNASKKKGTEIKPNYYQPPTNRRNTLNKQLSLSTKSPKSSLKGTTLSPIIGTPNRSDQDEANNAGEEGDENGTSASVQNSKENMNAVQRLMAFKSRNTKVHPALVSVDEKNLTSYKKSSMKSTITSTISKTLAKGTKNVDGSNKNVTTKSTVLSKKAGNTKKTDRKPISSRNTKATKADKNDSPKKEQDFSEIRGTHGLFSQESLEREDPLKGLYKGIGMGLGVGKISGKAGIKGRSGVASKKTTPVTARKNISTNSNKQRETSQTRIRDSSLNRKPPIPPQDKGMKKKTGPSSSINQKGSKNHDDKDSSAKQDDLRKMPSRTKLGSALSMKGSNSTLNNSGKKLEKKSSFRNPPGGNNNNSSNSNTNNNTNENSNNKATNDPSNKSETGTIKESRESVESDNEKLIPLTKSNIVSMTTAAITAQPVQISTTLANQMSQPRLGGGNLAASTTNADGTENTATSTTDIPKSDVPASLILEKSQKTLENIQKTVEEATNDIQKTINANLTDLKSMENNLSTSKDSKFEKSKSRDKLLMDMAKDKSNMGGDGSTAKNDDKNKSEMSSMRSSRETLRSLTKSAHIINKFRPSNNNNNNNNSNNNNNNNDSQRASTMNLENDNNNTISAMDNNLLKQNEKDMLMKKGGSGLIGEMNSDKEQMKKLKHDKNDNKLLVEKMSERAISVPPDVELESGNILNNNNNNFNRIEQAADSTGTSTRNMEQNSFDKDDENPGCCKCCKVCKCCLPCWGKICMPCRKSTRLAKCCKGKPKDRMVIQNEKKPSLWSRMNCCSKMNCSSCCRKNSTSQSTQNVMQSIESVSEVMGDKKPGKCASCFSSCFSCCKSKKNERPPVRDRMIRAADNGMETVKCCFCFKCKRKKKEPKRIVMAGRNESIVSESPPKVNCCTRFWHKLICCKKKEDPESRRTSLMSKKQSLAPTIQPPEDTRPKLDLTLVEHGSLMKGAIPILPTCLAWFCLVINFVIPGLGTIFSGFFCLCLGIPRFSQHDGAKARIGSFVINCIVGVSQTFTIMFCLVGWGWAIWWGAIMLRVSKKYYKLKELEAVENGEDQTTISNRTGASNANPPAVVSQNHHRDVEAGRS